MVPWWHLLTLWVELFIEWEFAFDWLVVVDINRGWLHDFFDPHFSRDLFLLKFLYLYFGWEVFVYSWVVNELAFLLLHLNCFFPCEHVIGFDFVVHPHIDFFDFEICFKQNLLPSLRMLLKPQKVFTPKLENLASLRCAFCWSWVEYYFVRLLDFLLQRLLLLLGYSLWCLLFFLIDYVLLDNIFFTKEIEVAYDIERNNLIFLMSATLEETTLRLASLQRVFHYLLNVLAATISI